MRTFFRQSDEFNESVTKYYDLVYALRTSMNYMNEVVDKLVGAGVHDGVLEHFFPVPEEATGQNVRAFAARDTLEKESDLAEMWFFAVFARYEGWAESLATPRGNPGIGNAKKGAQFPDSFTSAFEQLPVSIPMQRMFQNYIDCNKYYHDSANDMKLLLKLYRIYKEMRNSLIHSGHHVSQGTINAVSDLQGEGQAALDKVMAAVGIRERNFLDFSAGDPLTITFDNVTDAISVCHHLLVSIDGRLGVSVYGEVEFIERWRNFYGETIPDIQHKKLLSDRWVQNRVSDNLNLPLPPIVPPDGSHYWDQNGREAFYDFAISNKLVKWIR